MWPMGRRKTNAVQAEQPPTSGEVVDNVGANKWWVKCDNATFKKEILGMTWEQLHELAGKIQEDIRRTTLRPFVESLSDAEEQKLAARLAPVHRGRHEALVARIRSIVRENELPEDAK